MKKILTVCCLQFSIHIYSQIPTGTDIWLLDMKYDKGAFSFSNAINITNREGYDNQPAFSPDDKYILYSAIHEDKQADIYKYDIKTKGTSKFTNTPESEYSPTFMPGGKYISSVRVEIEKDSAQRLWKFSAEGGNAQLVMDKIDSVGYHCWINNDSLVLFILTKPFTLQAVNIRDQKTKIIAANIGRSIHSFNKQVFFTKEIDSTKWICSIDKKEIILKTIACIKNSEDFVLYKEYFIMADKNKLFKYTPGKSTGWEEIADLKQFGITKVTRIAISHDGKKMALVDNKSL